MSGSDHTDFIPAIGVICFTQGSFCVLPGQKREFMMNFLEAVISQNLMSTCL